MMVEVAIRVIDKINKNSYLDGACTKSGDVISIHPVGTHWGLTLTDPQWRILRADIPVSTIEALLSPESPGGEHHPQRMNQKRRYRVRVNSIPEDVMGSNGLVLDVAALDKYIKLKGV